MVGHDQSNKVIVPIIEWVSTATNHINISKYLTTCKQMFEDNLVPFPQIIVTDHSWALINAVLLAFNQCSLQNYLTWSYLILVDKRNDLELRSKMKVLIYLCSTHFLKCIIKNSKLIKVEKEIRRAFIYFFTLVQNSISVSQIEIYLINIHNIFMSMHFDMSVQYSLQTLATELKNRKLNNIDIDNEKSLPNERERDKHFTSFVEASNIYFVVNFDEKLKENSPWETLFINLNAEWDRLLEARSSVNQTSNLLPNPFYCPALYFLLRRELHKLPLWTGVLLPYIMFSYEIKTRLSNNPVENHFLQVKYRLLNRRSRLSCSEIIGPFYSNILAKFFKYYDDKNVLSASNIKKIGITIHQDTWKPEKPRKVKGRLVDAANILNLSEKNSAPFNSLKFDELFDKFYMKTENNNTETDIHNSNKKNSPPFNGLKFDLFEKFKEKTGLSNLATECSGQTAQATSTTQTADTIEMSEIKSMNSFDKDFDDSSSNSSSTSSKSSNLEKDLDLDAEINYKDEELDQDVEEDILNWFNSLNLPVKDLSKDTEVNDVKVNESFNHETDEKTIEK